MNIGSLDRLVTVQKKAVTKDPTYGSDVVAWVPLVPVAGAPTVGVKFRASVEWLTPGRGERLLGSALVVGRRQARVRLRWRNDVTSAMRVLVHGDGADEVLQIIGAPVEVGGRKRAIDLMCEEVTT